MMWKIALGVLAGIVLILFSLSFRSSADEIRYGVSFSKFRSEELGLPWQETYLALLDDLGVRNLRLVAHWPMIEPEKGSYDFSALDFQIKEAEKRGAKVILAVGRRLPSWPECHEPTWAKALPPEEQKEALLGAVERVVERYKNSPALSVWQVENEPFLEVFAYEHCGDLNEALLDEEIALVKSLDPAHPVLVTDSGNLGLWYPAWKRGDVFGTTMYRYLWNPTTGPIKSILPSAYYRIKANTVGLIAGGAGKKVIIGELQAEPWLLTPVRETPLSEQFDHFSIEKFDEMIRFASRTTFSEQYLWGAEWWYWLKREHGRDEFWNRAKELFK